MPETISELTSLWNRTLRRVKEEINDQKVYDSFLEGSFVDSVRGSTLIVAVNSKLGASLLTSKFRDLILRCLEETTGTNFDVVFVPEDELEKVGSEFHQEAPKFFADAHLDPKFKLDNFVVGTSNREAFQASLMISRDPGNLYNPLLLYSESGLGKTHLLQAIGNAIREGKPNAKVLYISAADFVDEYIRFVTGDKEDQSMVSFFKSSVDALLVDDIQFLIGKKKTMEMFFVIFQALYIQGKQIVLTSDQNPTKLEGLDDRLLTRFSQGLVLEIKRPDRATSESILRVKIESSGLQAGQFDDDVIAFLAERFSNNVRELEGALNRLLFYTINIRPSSHITMEIAREAIGGLVGAKENKGALTEEKILSTVADYYSFTPSQLTGKIRTAQIAMARHIAMYLIRSLLDTPFTKIGAMFGKDHSTVMTAVGKVESQLKEGGDYAKAVEDIKNRLKK